MARNKQPDLLERLWQNFSFRGFLLHQGTLFVLVSSLVIGSVVYLWKTHPAAIVDASDYALTADKIQVSPAPSWADTDLREYILADQQQPSILDPTLVSNTAAKIRTVGFVESVQQIAKSHAGLKVDLTYRHPVAAIEISPVTFPGVLPENFKRFYLCVDRHGVLMSPDVPVDPALPRLCMVFPAGLRPGEKDSLTSWTDTEDQRVRDGAAIAQYFVKDAKRIGLSRIVTFQKPLEVSASGDEAKQNVPLEEPFELWPDNNPVGTVVIWGQAPGKEGPSEAPVEQKLIALENYLAKFGPLNAPRGLKIDVRTGDAIQVSRDKVAELPTELHFQ